MSNKERFLWSAFGAVLVLLFLMSSTDLIIKEKKVEVYPVSIIIGRDSDAYYGNFKKGADKAAIEFHVDAKFITLYSSLDHEQQLELVQREIRDGARAVILEPVLENETVMALEAMNPSCPVILLGASAPSEFVADSILTDDQKNGRMLGEAVAGQMPGEAPVYLLSEGLSFTGNQRVYDGVSSVLEEKGYQYHLVERKDGDTFRRVIEETVYPGDKAITIVALDAPSLEEVSEIIEASTVYQSRIKGLYGPGCTMGILNKLDQGIIKGIVVSDQFNEGYLSVRRAVEAIQGHRQKQEHMLEAFYLEREDIRDKEYEKMLYPIE